MDVQIDESRKHCKSVPVDDLIGVVFTRFSVPDNPPVRDECVEHWASRRCPRGVFFLSQDRISLETPVLYQRYLCRTLVRLCDRNHRVRNLVVRSVDVTFTTSRAYQAQTELLVELCPQESYVDIDYVGPRSFSSFQIVFSSSERLIVMYGLAKK